jgi:hypothetical protein
MLPSTSTKHLCSAAPPTTPTMPPTTVPTMAPTTDSCRKSEMIVNFCGEWGKLRCSGSPRKSGHGRARQEDAGTSTPLGGHARDAGRKDSRVGRLSAGRRNVKLCDKPLQSHKTQMWPDVENVLRMMKSGTESGVEKANDY